MLLSLRHSPVIQVSQKGDTDKISFYCTHFCLTLFTHPDFASQKLLDDLKALESP